MLKGQKHYFEHMTFEEREEQKKLEEAGKVTFPDHTDPKLKPLIPNDWENEYKRSRMFSFEQVYDFFNLCLNKSLLNKRTRSAEEDVYAIQNQLKEFTTWRQTLEGRIELSSRDVTAMFEKRDRAKQKSDQKNEDDHNEIRHSIKTLDAQLNRAN